MFERLNIKFEHRTDVLHLQTLILSVQQECAVDFLKTTGKHGGLGSNWRT